MMLSRRSLLRTGAAVGAAAAFAPSAFAAPKDPAWHLGYTTAPAAGFDPKPMRLVSGKAPAGLAGALYRNGPAQFRYGNSFASHWFDGDGMVHRIAIADGKAIHSGRYVATRKRTEEQKAQRFLASGFSTAGDPSYQVGGPDDVNAANTSVAMSGGEMLALWEAGSAFRLDPVTLETRGPKVWRPDLKGMPFLAHPKREPDGRMWNLAVDSLANGSGRVGIYRIGADGALEDFGMVDTGAPAYIHDWSITETKLLILVQPWLNAGKKRPGIGAFEWQPAKGLKILVVDKNDLKTQRWAECDARAFYHTGAGWEEKGGTIRLDVCFSRAPALGVGGGASEIKGQYEARPGDSLPILTQLVIPPSGPARLEETGLGGEFPQVDPRRHGLRRKLTAIVGGDAPGRPGATSLIVNDWDSGLPRIHDFGANYMVEEHLFVPKPGSSNERDSWLVGTAINLKARASELVVFDAADISAGPVAVWRADYAWPLGFHGTWA